MHLTIAPDIQLFVDIEGPGLVAAGPVMRDKPTLVLLHGGPGYDHSGFKPAFSQLADIAQIVYYDHRGHGRSSRCPPEQWTLDNFADDLVRLCGALGVVKPIVLGQSFGGFVAQRYMHETGSTSQDLAAVTVSCREWAALHPNAMFRNRITEDDVLASRMVCTPMNALMLNMLSDGGSAIVVTTAERAKAAQAKPVYIWGEGGIVNTYSFAQHLDVTRMNWAQAAAQAFGHKFHLCAF